MSQPFHRLMHSPRDFITSLLRHGRGIGPVVLAREHVDGTGFGVDSCHTGAAVPAWLVKVSMSEGKGGGKGNVPPK